MFFRETHGNWSRLALICNKLLEGLAALIGRGERGENRRSRGSSTSFYKTVVPRSWSNRGKNKVPTTLVNESNSLYRRSFVVVTRLQTLFVAVLFLFFFYFSLFDGNQFGQEVRDVLSVYARTIATKLYRHHLSLGIRLGAPVCLCLSASLDYDVAVNLPR